MGHTTELAANHVNVNDLPYFPYAPGVDCRVCLFEPAGAVHTFRSDPEQGITAFIVVEGALEFLDAAGNTMFIDNWQSILQKYLDFCVKSGIEPVDVTSF